MWEIATGQLKVDSLEINISAPITIRLIFTWAEDLQKHPASCKEWGLIHQGTFPSESALNLRHCDITGYLPLEALSIFKYSNSKVLTIAGDYRFCGTFRKITSGILPLVIWKICCIIFHVCGGVRVLRVSWPSACKDLHIFYAG